MLNKKYDDYTNVNFLKKFLTKFGKLKARQQVPTSLKLKSHRYIAKRIKRGRNLKIIPFEITIKE